MSGQGPTRGTRVYACARAAASSAASRVTDREVWLRLGRWLWASPGAEGNTTSAGLFRPPDVWSTDRPSLRRQVAYARWGVQHPARGPLRAFSVAYAAVGLLLQAALYFAAWVVERPGRLVAGYALLAVLLQVPAVRDVAVVVGRVLIAPLTWLA